MDDKNVKVSDNTHQRLVDYVVENPVIKLNKFADLAINKLLDEVRDTKPLSIFQYQQKQANDNQL